MMIILELPEMADLTCSTLVDALLLLPLRISSTRTIILSILTSGGHRIVLQPCRSLRKFLEIIGNTLWQQIL